MEGKINKIKDLKIVSFPISIRRSSQLKTWGDIFLFLDWINFQLKICKLISSSEAGPTFAFSNTVIKQ